jgi:hypothetical protein
MKKIITLSFISVITLVVFQSSIVKTMRSQGAEPGHTGSPGDGFKDCTNCHGGSAATVPGWISSNIPTSGYVPGQRYTISTTNGEQEGTRFGFQVSPQNIAGDLLGQLVITDSIQTQLVGNGKYITYTENGIDGQGSKTWTFDWIAPDAGTGDVTFYGAYNSNFEGHKGENHVFLSTLTVKESGASHVSSVTGENTRLQVYPNPAKEWIQIRFHLSEQLYYSLDITDFKGRHVAQIKHEKSSGPISTRFNTSDLPNGLYMIRLQTQSAIVTQKIWIIH